MAPNPPLVVEPNPPPVVAPNPPPVVAPNPLLVVEPNPPPVVAPNPLPVVPPNTPPVVAEELLFEEGCGLVLFPFPKLEPGVELLNGEAIEDPKLNPELLVEVVLLAPPGTVDAAVGLLVSELDFTAPKAFAVGVCDEKLKPPAVGVEKLKPPPVVVDSPALVVVD